jgi:hypothetical protein
MYVGMELGFVVIRSYNLRNDAKIACHYHVESTVESLDSSG